MGIHVLALYRPREGKADALEAEVRGHVSALRSLGLATTTPATALRASDGTIIEHFEWVDQAAIDAAHEHPDVQVMWQRFDECCTFVTLGQLPNTDAMFPEFEFLGVF